MVAALLPIAPPTVSAVGELPGVEEALFADSSVSFNEGWVELLDDIAEGIETQIELLNDVPMLEDRLRFGSVSHTCRQVRHQGHRYRHRRSLGTAVHLEDLSGHPAPGG